MLILIDGYNVIAPTAAPRRADPAGWLRAERQLLIDRLLTHLDDRLARETCVVFDARPGAVGRGDSRQSYQGLEVRFAVDHDEADDLIEELIAGHPAAKRLTVVTSDRRLRSAARRAGASSFDSQRWLDSLLDDRLLLAIPWPSPANGDRRDRQPDLPAGQREVETPIVVDEWLEHFGLLPPVSAEISENPEPARQDRSQRTRKSPQRPPETRQWAVETGEPSDARPSRVRELSDDESPFPPGYGEDLLTDND
jgi:predicted RNA-binding protein with PIN domain